jgi:hypothetical protein
MHSNQADFQWAVPWRRHAVNLALWVVVASGVFAAAYAVSNPAPDARRFSLAVLAQP